MKTYYIAPLTEIVVISVQDILENESTDSTGNMNPWEGPESPDANSGTFDEDATNSSRNLWDD